MVYALQYRLDDRSTVMVWLDRAGRPISPFKPEEPGKLMVTVKPCDSIISVGKRQQVVSF